MPQASRPQTVLINAAGGGDFSWRQHLADLFRYRHLLRNIVVRDLKVRYKNSVLGILWSLLNPLLMMVVFSLIFTLFPGENTRQYAVFFLTGLIPWQFFSGALLGGTRAIVDNTSLVKKVYFPRELLPLAAVFSNLVNFLIAIIVLGFFVLGSGLGISIHILWFPLILVTQIILVLGLSFFLSALNVFYRDVLMILDVVLLAGFFLTPIFYPLEQYGAARTLLGITFNPAQVMRWINPMASIVDAYRTILWGTSTSTGPGAMDLAFFLRTLVTALLICVLGYLYFRRTQHHFAERL